ncbi:hypothetical protein NESM_000433800 [Novymonas esmeraldas]|uniref:Uncharacterized protein n=1 Tax=Novymonas esmeraldas TaxID=1808958 RepID=A0AAW0EPN0_9TRYP
MSSSSPPPPPSTESGMAAAATQTGNVSEIMAAIQRVLAEHNVGDARFVLELPPATAATDTTTAAAAVAAAAAAASAPAPVSAAVDTPASALLAQMQALPATAPPPPPAHQPPPPRARSPSAQKRPATPPHSRLPHHPAPPHTAEAAPLADTVSALGATARPSTSAATLDGHVKASPPPPPPPTAAAAAAAAPPEPTSPPQIPFDTLSSDDAAVVLTDEAAAEMRRVSHQLAQDLAAAETHMSRKEMLQTFVGRSAILDERRQREAHLHAQTPTPSLNGVPFFAAPPKSEAAVATPPSSPPTRRAAPASTARVPAAGATPDAAMSLSLPPEPQQPQRRSLVRLTSPPAPPSVSVSPGGARSVGAVASDGGGSLPSLVAAKKTAVPGRTPVFSILNKDGSRLLENGGGAADVVRPSSTNESSTSSAVSRHSRPGSVSVLADDRAPPSPIHEPLLGSAAAEEARRQGSILVGSQPRAATSEPTPPPVLESTESSEERTLPKLWSEQSKDNTRRAAQLQSHGRLSQATDVRQTVPPATSTAAGGSSRLDSSPVSSALRSPPRPATSSAATTTTGATARASSLQAMLREQQRQQDASRRSLEEHQRLMQTAGAARPAALTPAAATASASGAGAHTAPPLPTAARPARLAATAAPTARTVPGGDGDEAPSKGSVSGSTRASSPAGHGASGIQVVKFTLPHEQEARQAAVQQLCRTSAGTQHVDSKDRYRALLAAQQNELTAQEAKAQSYKELLGRAMDFNRQQQQQQQSRPS